MKTSRQSSPTIPAPAPPDVDAFEQAIREKGEYRARIDHLVKRIESEQSPTEQVTP